MDISTIGIDLSKTTFHLIGLSPRGEIVLRKKLSRKQLLTFTATLYAVVDRDGSLCRKSGSCLGFERSRA